MANNGVELTIAEWSVMECFWEKSPRTGREAAEYLAETKGWSRSTTLTLLRRMTAKGILDCREENGIRTYYPLIPWEEAIQQETSSFLDRVYHGSVSMMLNCLTSRQALTQQELEELQAILSQAEGGNTGV